MNLFPNNQINQSVGTEAASVGRIAATVVVSIIAPADVELLPGAIVDVVTAADPDEETFPNVETKTLIRVIRKIPKTDKLLILSADAKPLFRCTLY